MTSDTPAINSGHFNIMWLESVWPFQELLIDLLKLFNTYFLSQFHVLCFASLLKPNACVDNILPKRIALAVQIIKNSRSILPKLLILHNRIVAPISLSHQMQNSAHACIIQAVQRCIGNSTTSSDSTKTLPKCTDRDH